MTDNDYPLERIASLAEQWDLEAQSARDEAAGLPQVTENVERHRALRNLARTSAHHAEQLRAALSEVAAR